MQELAVFTAEHRHECTEGHSNCPLVDKSGLANQIATAVSHADKNVSRPDHDAVRNIGVDKNVVVKAKRPVLDVG